MCKQSFEVWKVKVDAMVQEMCGMDCDDLPDLWYWDAWNDGISYVVAAAEVIEAANERAMRKQAYDVWMVKVDAMLFEMCGVTSDGLPDWQYWHAWNAGTSYVVAAAEAIEAAKEF